ncbi:MAG: hypothetical protein H6831_03495 [Planctomycetes bacterium]|nr:hypothetical protein [Planctomycetota bacterium]MCB9903450.1 hypothetical protein [Planctomycetota bacterium]
MTTSDSTQGSTGSVISALASFFIPGLGQLLQARLLRAAFFFVTVGVLYWSIVGWPFGALVHLWAIVDAATFKPR